MLTIKPTPKTVAAAAPAQTAKAKFATYNAQLDAAERQDAATATKTVGAVLKELPALRAAAQRDKTLRPSFTALEARICSISRRPATGSAKAAAAGSQALGKGSPKALEWVTVNTDFGPGRSPSDFRRMAIVQEGATHYVLLSDKYGTPIGSKSFKSAAEAENYVMAERQKELGSSKPATPPPSGGPAGSKPAANRTAPVQYGPTYAQLPANNATVPARVATASAGNGSAAPFTPPPPTNPHTSSATVPARAPSFPSAAPAPLADDALVRDLRNLNMRMRALQENLTKPGVSEAELRDIEAHLNSIRVELPKLSKRALPFPGEFRVISQLSTALMPGGIYEKTLGIRKRLNEHEQALIAALERCNAAAKTRDQNGFDAAMAESHAAASQRIRLLYDKITPQLFEGTLLKGATSPEILLGPATSTYHQIVALRNKGLLRKAGVKALQGSFNQYANRNVKGGHCDIPCTMVAAQFLNYVLPNIDRVTTMKDSVVGGRCAVIDGIVDLGKSQFATYWERRNAQVQLSGGVVSKPGFINLREIAEQPLAWNEFMPEVQAVQKGETVQIADGADWATAALDKFDSNETLTKPFGFTLTNRDKTSAMVCLADGRYAFFDSHGDAATIGVDKAFMLTFPNKAAAAQYLRMHYPHQNGGGDRNLISVNFVLPKAAAQPAPALRKPEPRPVAAAQDGAEDLIAALSAPLVAPMSAPKAAAATAGAPKTVTAAAHSAAAKPAADKAPKLVTRGDDTYYEDFPELKVYSVLTIDAGEEWVISDTISDFRERNPLMPLKKDENGFESKEQALAALKRVVEFLRNQPKGGR